MSHGQSLSGGLTHRTVTDAQLAARTVVLNHPDFTNIYDDFNLTMASLINIHHGYNLIEYDRNLGKGTVTDFTRVYISRQRCTANILDDATIIQQLRDKININTLPSRLSMVLLLHHLRQQVPNAIAIDDDTLLTSPDYQSYRDTFEFHYDVNEISGLPNTQTFNSGPLATEFGAGYTELLTWLIDISARNICYKLISHHPNGFTRMDIAKTIHDYISDCRHIYNGSVDYLTLKAHATINNPELSIVRNLNEALISILHSEIDLTSEESILEHFKDRAPCSSLYVYRDFATNVTVPINTLCQHLLPAFTKEHFAAYFQYIECDVYMYDISESRDTSLFTKLDDHMVTSRYSIVLDPNSRHTGYSSTYGDITNIYSVKVTPESILAGFIEYFYMLNHQYPLSSIYMGSDAATDIMQSTPLTSLLFVLTDIQRYIQPQRVLDYIGHCISLINPHVANRAMTRVRSVIARLVPYIRRYVNPTAGVDYIRSEPATELHPFAGGASHLPEDIIVKTIVGLGLIIFVVVLIYLFKSKEKFTESYIERLEGASTATHANGKVAVINTNAAKAATPPAPVAAAAITPVVVKNADGKVVAVTTAVTPTTTSNVTVNPNAIATKPTTITTPAAAKPSTTVANVSNPTLTVAKPANAVIQPTTVSKGVAVTKSTPNTYSIKPIHPKRYTIYDYVRGKVPCDGEHLKRGVDKSTRNTVSQTPNANILVANQAVVDPKSIVNSNSTTDMFAVH